MKDILYGLLITLFCIATSTVSVSKIAFSGKKIIETEKKKINDWENPEMIGQNKELAH